MKTPCFLAGLKHGLLLALLGGLTAGVSARPLPPIQFTPVVPGLDYARVAMTNWNTNLPWSVHIARMDRTQTNLGILTTLARVTSFGGSKVSQQAKSIAPQDGRPLACVNGDFFNMDKSPYYGDPGGLQIIRGELVSAPKRSCFWVDATNGLHAANVRSLFRVTWPAGGQTPFGLNEACGPKEAAVLYTSWVGKSTHATNGLGLILEKAGDSPWLPLRACTTYQARVCQIRTNADTVLTSNTMVLHLSADLAAKLPALNTGDVLKLETAMSEDLSQAREGIGGAPIILENGRLLPVNVNTYLQARHPRTALGFNDRYFYLFLVDGRQQKLSMGMNPWEVGEFIQSLGCTEAMNLDGGGSTTFWLDGKVVSSPSGKVERTVANTLAIVLKPGVGAREPQSQ